MNTSSESAVPPFASPSESPVPAMSLRSRLDAATMALLHTRDQVVRALDAHLAEMHGLRQVLAEAEQQSLVEAQPLAVAPPAPAAAPLPPPLPQPPTYAAPQMASPPAPVVAYDPPAPPPPPPPTPEPVLAALQGLQEALLHKVPVTPAPMPMSEVFPDRLPDFSEAPAVSPFSVPLQAQVPMSAPLPPPPAASRPLVMPTVPPQMMSFQTAFTTVAPEPAAQHAPVLPPPQVSAPLSRPLSVPVVPPSLTGQVAMPAPVSGAVRPAAELPPARQMAREVAADPRMEQATLEDLNAALAFAFSQATQPSRPLVAEAPVSSRPLSPPAQWNLPPRV